MSAANDWPYDEDPDKVTLFCHPDDEEKLRVVVEILGDQDRVTVRASGVIEEPGTAYAVKNSALSLDKKINWEYESTPMPILDPFEPFRPFRSFVTIEDF